MAYDSWASLLSQSVHLETEDMLLWILSGRFRQNLRALSDLDPRLARQVLGDEKASSEKRYITSSRAVK